MRAQPVDARDQRWQFDEPTYRVVFRSQPSGADPDPGWQSDEWEISGADIDEVLTWVRDHAGGRRASLWVVTRSGTDVTHTRLAGSDPTGSEDTWPTWASAEWPDRLAPGVLEVDPRPERRDETPDPTDDASHLDRTRRDYDELAQQYDDFIRNDVSHARTIGTAMVTTLAELVRANGSLAPVLDAGCGPGHWTASLVELGTPAYGVDLSPAMVAIARDRRPDVRFEIGSVLELSDADSSVGGILAHFSLIHLPPPLVDAALAEFARVAEPGAPLLIGVQMTDDAVDDGWVRYGHTVSAAYRWNLDALSARLRRSGFAELARLRMEGSSADKPPAGYLLARHRP